VVGGIFVPLQDILVWVGFWTVVGFALMGEDKHLAKRQSQQSRPNRIRERTLQEVALVGGFPGIILGAVAFNHKTKKFGFWVPVMVAIAVWLVILRGLSGT
jgi:uncharacterized membrane protein YsdA (DUF1294 family)